MYGPLFSCFKFFGRKWSIYFYTINNDIFRMEEIELNILRLIHEIVGTGGSNASDDKIAQSSKISYQDTLDFLDMLERQGYVTLTRSIDGVGARLTAPGRLLLTHPDYMVNK